MPEFTKNLENTLHNALKYAETRQHSYATLEHLLLALTDDPEAIDAFTACDVNITQLKESVTAYLDKELNAITSEQKTDPEPTSGFSRAVQRAILHVQSSGVKFVTGANVLIALFSERDSYAVFFLQQQDLTRLDVVSYVWHGIRKNGPNNDRDLLNFTERQENTANSIKMDYQVYVSYAWGDQRTASGRIRDKAVQDLCALAERSGIAIIRDKDAVKIGDSISNFMDKIGNNNLVFVILSKKYLMSPYCMYELSEIWRNSRLQGEIFLNRVKIIALPDAKIFSPKDWVYWSLYWKKEHADLDELARQHGPAVLGERGYKRLLQMQQFYIHIPDILGTISDIVLPRTTKELVEFGVSDMKG